MTSKTSPSSSQHEAVLSFLYEDRERARRVERSLRPEVGAIGGDRTRTSVEREDRSLIITVEATDLVALRAGLNTWATLVEIAETSGAVGAH